MESDAINEEIGTVVRIKPHDFEAEKSIIASMIMDRENIVTILGILTPEDFYDTRYAICYSVIQKLFDRKEDADVVTVLNELKKTKGAETFANIEFINGIIMSTATSAGAAAHANIVKECSLLRKLIDAADRISYRCYKNTDELDSILDTTEKEIFEVINKRISSEVNGITEIVERTIDSIELASRMKGGITGIPTGFIDLDAMLSGLHNGELVLIAARPSMGKSAFALNIASYVALNKKIPTAIFSLEMPNEQNMKRIISSMEKVPAGNISNGTLDENEWIGIWNASRNISESDLIMDDTSGISLMEMRSKCRKLKLEKNLGLVVIDYLQLMNGDAKAESRQQEISGISRGLKIMARELEIPVIALSQLSRGVESRTDKRPMLSDLRESGAIEQDADVVMFIYRDEYYNKESKDRGVAEISISKQRNGPTGVVRLGWQPEYTRFVNLQQ
jgi:replicative DNA helicase